jgi:hypothetical protein
MTEKRCCSCGRVKPVSEYNCRRSAKDGLQARCRSCSRDWYEAHKEQHKQNTRRISRQVTARYREKIAEYLVRHPCVDCGETNVACLEFDHRDASTKVADIATLLRYRHAWSRIEAEIEKCDVRCANCHRIVTAARSGSWRVAAQAAAVAARASSSGERLSRVMA